MNKVKADFYWQYRTLRNVIKLILSTSFKIHHVGFAQQHKPKRCFVTTKAKKHIEQIIIAEFDLAEEENDLSGMLKALEALAKLYGIFFRR